MTESTINWSFEELQIKLSKQLMIRCGFTKAFKNFAKYIIAFIFAKFKYFAKQIIYLESTDHQLQSDIGYNFVVKNLNLNRVFGHSK